MKKKEVESLQQLLASMTEPFHLTYRFVALAEIITRESDSVYADALGLGIKEFRILRLVKSHPGQPVATIRRWSFVEKAMMSRLLTPLCEQGLLKREVDLKDARSNLLYITRRGAKLVDKADLLVKDLIQQRHPSLTRERCARLMAELDPILLEAARSGAEDDA
jgi:DNA-binding MarR family transcriptional regulator